MTGSCSARFLTHHMLHCSQRAVNSSPARRPASGEGRTKVHSPDASFVATKESSSPSLDNPSAMLSGLGMYSAHTLHPKAAISDVARRGSRDRDGTWEPALTKQVPAAWLSTNHNISRPRSWSANVWKATIDANSSAGVMTTSESARHFHEAIRSSGGSKTVQ